MQSWWNWVLHSIGTRKRSQRRDSGSVTSAEPRCLITVVTWWMLQVTLCHTWFCFCEITCRLNLWMGRHPSLFAPVIYIEMGPDWRIYIEVKALDLATKPTYIWACITNTSWTLLSWQKSWRHLIWKRKQYFFPLRASTQMACSGDCETSKNISVTANCPGYWIILLA